jgi:hypothetical protein
METSLWENVPEKRRHDPKSHLMLFPCRSSELSSQYRNLVICYRRPVRCGRHEVLGVPRMQSTPKCSPSRILFTDKCRQGSTLEMRKSYSLLWFTVNCWLLRKIMFPAPAWPVGFAVSFSLDPCQIRPASRDPHHTPQSAMLRRIAFRCTSGTQASSSPSPLANPPPKNAP